MGLYTVPQLWPGGTIVVMATGPSMTQADADYCRGRAPVVVVNDNYRLAPWADVLYASDADWWDLHEGVPDFEGIKITRDRNGGKEAAQRWGLNSVKLITQRKNISHDPTCIHSGNNSGYQAVNVAALLIGCKGKIVLLGFDMKGQTHWFGKHPGRLNRRHAYDTWKRHFGTIQMNGFEIVDCTRDPGLPCYRKARLEDEI